MKSYKDILGEIQRLQGLAAKRRRKEVGAVIGDIRQKMADYGITLDELSKRSGARAAKGKKGGGKKTGSAKKAAKRKVAPKYRDPKTGAKWSGRGLTPAWLKEKEKTGAKREEVLIKRK